MARKIVDTYNCLKYKHLLRREVLKTFYTSAENNSKEKE